MADCAALLVEAAEGGRRACSSHCEGPHGRPLCRAGAADRRRGVPRFAGIDLLATLQRGEGDRDKLAAAAQRGRHPDRRRRQLVRHVQPRAGRTDRAAARRSAGRRCSIEYPSAGGGLGDQAPTTRGWRERFELYACGVELANGFAELTDAAEQRRRFEDAMAEKQRALWRTLSDRRRFSRRARQHAAGERHRAGLRPAGDAGDRRAADRAGAVGAGGRRRQHNASH